MKKYKLVVFDWDGTIINSIGVIIHSIQKTAEEFNVAIPSDEAIRDYISHNASSHLLELFPVLDKEKTFASFKAHYAQSLTSERLFPGVANTLRSLKQRGMVLAIATNKIRSALDASLGYHHLADYFSTIRTADGAHAKPHPGVITTILAELEMQHEHALMVGDSPCDMMVAKNAGIDAVAVSYGISSKETLLTHAPIACIDHMEKLLKVIDF